MSRKLAWSAAILLCTAACDDGTSPNDSSRLRVAFAAVDTTGTQSNSNQLVVTGTNGTLTITDVRMMVSEFELKGPRACVQEEDNGELELEHCEFESAPFLLDLDLDGDPIVVATTDVPTGAYTEVEFEVEDLKRDHDDDDRTGDAISALRAELRSAFPNFPDDASVVVVGTFTPTGGTARPFTVFLDADIDFELPLIPPLIINDAGANRTVTVELTPRRWFLRGGRVIDLSAFNNRLLEFGEDFRLGIHRARCDDGN
jgi:hypothetical protein